MEERYENNKPAGQGNGGFKKTFYKPRPAPREGGDNFVFGIRPIEEAIKTGKTIEKILMVKDQENLREIRAEAQRLHIPYSFVPEVKLDRMTPKNHQGILAFISPITYANLSEIVTRCFEEGKTPLILVLDRITDVRNFGLIIFAESF